MPLFTVTETCTYKVEAPDVDVAKTRFLNASDVREFFSEVTERDIDGDEF